MTEPSAEAQAAKIISEWANGVNIAHLGKLISDALAEKDAELAETRGLAKTNRLGWLSAATRMHELEAVVAWAREARWALQKAHDHERESCLGCALLARAPEGV